MKLLIGYDGSQCADEALDDLARAGLPPDATAEVLTVADVILPPSPSEEGGVELHENVLRGIEEAREAVHEALSVAERGAARLRARFPGWNVHARSQADAPAWGLIKRADSWSADLIVLGARGEGAWHRMMMGSVSNTVAAEASCSVRVYRRDMGQPEPESGAEDGTAPVRIIVAVDGSSNAERAVDAVVARNWPPGSTVRVVSVLDGKLGGSLAAGVEAVRRWEDESGGEIDDGQSWVRRMVGHGAERLRASGLEVVEVVREGDPKHVLVDEVAGHAADVIFVGARGLGRVERVLLGSLSRAVVLRAPCTVEIVH